MVINDGEMIRHTCINRASPAGTRKQTTVWGSGTTIYLLSLFLMAFYFLIILLLFNYRCPHFPLITLPALPCPPPAAFCPPSTHCPCPWFLYTCSLTHPLLSPITPSLLSSGLVSLFFTSMSLVLFCSLVCFVH